MLLLTTRWHHLNPLYFMSSEDCLRRHSSARNIRDYRHSLGYICTIRSMYLTRIYCRGRAVLDSDS